MLSRSSRMLSLSSLDYHENRDSCLCLYQCHLCLVKYSHEGHQEDHQDQCHHHQKLLVLNFLNLPGLFQQVLKN